MKRFSKKIDDKPTLTDYLNIYLAKRDKNDELEIRFGTKKYNSITKIKFDNLINKVKNNGFIKTDENQYHLNIQNEYNDPATGRKKLSNIRTTIKGLDNIQKYCKTNNFDKDNIPNYISFMHKYHKVNSSIEKLMPIDVHDFEFRINYKEERTLTKKHGLLNSILNSWMDSKKTFRLIKRSSFVHPDFPFKIDCSIIKTSKNISKTSRLVPTFTIEESGVFDNIMLYEIELEIINKLAQKYSVVELEEKVRKGIKMVLSGLQNSNYPVSYRETNNILKEYLQLTQSSKIFEQLRDDNYYNLKKRKSRKYFIGPSSISLEMENIVDLQSSSATKENINYPYTVTDKADGERKLLYVANNLKIYLININLEVEFTGLVCSNDLFRETIIDGEHVLYDKNNNLINYFLCFDIYYVNSEDYRLFAFVNTPNLEYENKIADLKYRYNELINVVNEINSNSQSVSRTGVSLKIMVKEFYPNLNKSIFTQCKTLLQKVKDGMFEYETDGLIFTPIDKSVGSTKLGVLERNKTWNLSFKWKPPEYNTIDFLITTQKDKNGEDLIVNSFVESSANNIKQYKVVILRVGFSEKSHGFLNPFIDVVEDNIYQETKDRDNYNDYKPAPFYPTNPTPSYKIHICYIPLVRNVNNLVMLTEDGKQEIEDNMIVEFRFDKNMEEHQQWIPIRVRYDKTSDYRKGNRNYGNAYHVAQSVWRSINNPVTENIITSGSGIIENSDATVYYNRKSKETNTAALRDFHNKFVKTKIITSVANKGNTLIDMSVGKAGDMYKWMEAKLSFVFGIDYSKDNIENRMDGACVRYIKKKRKVRNMLDALFIHGSAVNNIKNTDSAFDDRGKRIINALLGIGEKDERRLGRGVYKSWGRAKNGFNIVSNQFSIHYFFGDVYSINNFIRNCAEMCKLNGYVIGTCYDGTKIFNRLRDKNVGESIFHIEKGKKMWSITKDYTQTTFDATPECLGYKINVYQESINKSFDEYLVNFDYFKQLMYNYGFEPLPRKEANKLGLQESIGSFQLLFNDMKQKVKQKLLKKTTLGKALQMTEKEKDVSFLNNYFVFKKVRNVAVENVFNIEISKGDTSSKVEFEKKSREVIKNIMAEKINKVVLKKFKKKFIIPSNEKK